MTVKNFKKNKIQKKTLLSICVLIIFFIVLVFYVYNNFAKFKEFLHIPYQDSIPIFILFSIFLWLNSELARLILLIQKIKLNYVESMALYSAGALANFVTPFKGGMGMKAFYLKSKYNFTFTNFFAQNSILAILVLAISSFYGILASFLLKLEGHPFEKINFIMFIYFVSSFISLLIILFGIGRIKVSENFLKGYPARLVEGWQMITSSKALWGRLFLISLLIPLGSAALNYFALKAYGINLSLGGILFYTAGYTHLSIISITPGALGFLEAYSMYLGRVFDYSPERALVAQGFLRLVSLTLLLLWGTWGSLKLGLRNKSQ